MKEQLAQEIAKRAKNGQVIGVGTGSTVDAALEGLGEKVKKEGLQLSFVTTSHQSAWRCESLGLCVLYPGYRGQIDWGFDGADEVDEQLRLIKGKGAAMLQEKILARRCQNFLIIIEQHKLVKKLGEVCPIPIEVIPQALSHVEQELKKLGASTWQVRSGSGKHGPTISENSNLIVDAKFAKIEDALESKIKNIVGVVESGLFVNYTREVLVAAPAGLQIMKS